MPDANDRHETEHERLDRNLVELIQELRVAQTGVQILFAFLLALPFAARFDKVSAGQRGLYLTTLIFSAAATAFLIAPVAYHRLVFHLDAKQRLVFLGNAFAIIGLACLALAISCAIFLIVDVLYHGVVVALVTGGLALLFAVLWFVLPLSARASAERASRRTPSHPRGSPRS